MDYEGMFGASATAAGVSSEFKPLDNLIVTIASSGWHLTTYVGIFVAVIELLLVGVHLYLNAANPNARAESKKRGIKIVIVSAIMFSLAFWVSQVERLGLDIK